MLDAATATWVRGGQETLVAEKLQKRLSQVKPGKRTLFPTFLSPTPSDHRARSCFSFFPLFIPKMFVPLSLLDSPWLIEETHVSLLLPHPPKRILFLIFSDYGPPLCRRRNIQGQGDMPTGSRTPLPGLALLFGT